MNIKWARIIVLGLPSALCGALFVAAFMNLGSRLLDEAFLILIMLFALLSPFIVLFCLSFRFQDSGALIFSAILIIIGLCLTPAHSDSHGMSPMVIFAPLILAIIAAPLFFGVRRGLAFFRTKKEKLKA